MSEIKLKFFGSAVCEKDGGYVVSLSIPVNNPVSKVKSMRKVDLDLPPDLDYNNTEPVLVDWGGENTYLYRNRLVTVVKGIETNQEELKLRIKHFVLKQEKELDKINKEIEAFESFEKAKKSRREKIPDNVKIFVWQRDEGKCAKCGSSEKLEFDHIIPVSKGGANTARNIQLLCETCNREKSNSI